MINNKKHKVMPVNAFKAARLWFCLLAILASLAACSQNHIPLGEYRIEWDEFIPKLHSQTVIFNVPMSYAHLEPEDINYGWKKEFIDIGRLLWWSNSDGISVYEPEPIKVEMKFVIKGSFWYRANWFDRGYIDDDIHYLLLIDENDNKSIVSFLELADSNRTDLMAFESYGQYE